MAGGRGTRISELFPDIPKPMISIESVPVLEREIRSLSSQGFKDIIITVSYLHEKIEEYFSELRGNWENEDSITVRKSRIEMKVLEVNGVMDIENISLYGSDGNIVVDSDKIPVLGTVESV